MDKKVFIPPNGWNYQIPYRILVPSGINNLLVAGRCVSVDHEALGSLRLMPQCGVMGQAAGVAATIAIKENCEVSNVPISKLQSELKRQKCIVDDSDVALYNKTKD